jgi:hypothetical protein
MSLIESEIQNVIDLRNSWRKGKTGDLAFKRELHASQVLNRWVMTKIVAEIKSDNGMLKRLRRQDFVSTTQAVDLGSPDSHENEKVKCPVQEDKMILRHECLDYSGSHFEDCNGCEIGSATREMLLPARD